MIVSYFTHELLTFFDFGVHCVGHKKTITLNEANIRQTEPFDLKQRRFDSNSAILFQLMKLSNCKLKLYTGPNPTEPAGLQVCQVFPLSNVIQGVVIKHNNNVQF